MLLTGDELADAEACVYGGRGRPEDEDEEPPEDAAAVDPKTAFFIVLEFFPEPLKLKLDDLPIPSTLPMPSVSDAENAFRSVASRSLIFRPYNQKSRRSRSRSV